MRICLSRETRPFLNHKFAVSKNEAYFDKDGVPSLKGNMLSSAKSLTK